MKHSSIIIVPLLVACPPKRVVVQFAEEEGGVSTGKKCSYPFPIAHAAIKFTYLQSALPAAPPPTPNGFWVSHGFAEYGRAGDGCYVHER